MKTKKLLIAILLAMFTVCSTIGLAFASSSAEPVNDWIKISPNGKYIYTLDGEGQKGAFAFNEANNCNGKILMIDLGMKADGVTPEADQCYVLSKIQIASFANVTSATVEVSTDGENYRTVATITEFSAWQVVEFNEANARYIRITPEGSWQTMWGADYPVAFWGRAGQIEEVVVPTDGWIKITPDSKYIYTLDGEGQKGTFAFNEANNCNGKTLMIDFGMKADGVTPETDQCYILSKMQIVNFVNVTSATVDVSTDGEHYTTIVTVTDFTAWKEHSFGEVNARYVRITPEGSWQTMWGAEYVVAFWGRAGQLDENNDPLGVNIARYKSDVVYPVIKGDNIQLDASKVNVTGEGEITYTVDADPSVATVSSTGTLQILSTGDGTTVYTVTASVPNPAGGDYTAEMKFTVLEEELSKITDIYLHPDTGAYELLDLVNVQLVRISENAAALYSIDGANYAELNANVLLETPVCAQFVKIEGSDLAVYGVKNYGAATAVGVTSENIDGFYPEHPLENLIDGSILNMAQTERANFMGAGEIKGSVTVELDACYDITGVRVFSFWNSLGECSVSYSYDGVTFTGEEFFTLTYCNCASIGAEFYDLLIPFEPARASFVRINIYGFGPTSDSFLAMREITVYGEKVSETVSVTYDNGTNGTHAGLPRVETVVFGTQIESPADLSLEGYVFGGWYKDETCLTPAVFPCYVTEDTVFYAKWTAIPTYSVTYSAIGEGSVTGVPENAVYSNTQITVTVTAKDGWVVKEVKVNDENKTPDGDSLVINVRSDTTISVVFEELPKESDGCNSSIGGISVLAAALFFGAAMIIRKKENE